jgi:transposase
MELEVHRRFSVGLFDASSKGPVSPEAQLLRLSCTYGPQAWGKFHLSFSQWCGRRGLLKGYSIPRMAPNLADSQHAVISDMSHSKLFKANEIAKVAGCNPRSIYRINNLLRCFGSTKAPLNGVGRPRSITPPMLDALCEHLLEKPGLYQYEMVDFLRDEFEVHVTTSSIGRALASRGWTKKTIGRVAKARNADLRNLYLHNTSDFRSYHYVFVDESSCDRRIGFRRTGWSPLGVTPIQVSRFQRK